MEKKFLSAQEAIQAFGLDPEQFQQQVDDGELRALADRGDWKYRRDEILGLIDSGVLAARYPAGDGATADEPEILPFAVPDGDGGPEDFSFFELDEEALAEGATVIKKTSDLDSPEEVFVDIIEATPTADQTSSEVTLVADSEPSIQLPESSSEMPVAESLSDLDIVIKGATPSAEAPVVLSPDALGVTESDSDVKVMEASISDAQQPVVDGTDHAILADDSVITPALPASGVSFSDSDVRIADSGISLETAPENVDSGLTLAGSEVLGRDSSVRIQDSGISLEQADSGITLEQADSGISLEADSGLTLESLNVDSGLTLTPADSGIALDTIGDSGIAIGGPDSGISVGRKPQNLDETQPEFEASFDDDYTLDDPDQTAMIALDEDDAAETLPPSKSRGKTASLSESFASSEEVEDLEIVEDLEAGELEVDDDEIADVEDEDFEDALEASDEAFTMSESGEVMSEAELSAASIPVVKAVSREPSWGVAALIPVAVCALLLVVNSLILWDGLSTMWNGDTSKALGVSIIDSLSGLI